MISSCKTLKLLPVAKVARLANGLAGVWLQKKDVESGYVEIRANTTNTENLQHLKTEYVTRTNITTAGNY